MAVEDLNAKGVTVGGKKIKLELVAEDDAADPKQGAAVATKLCDSKVQGVVGHLNSGTTIPASKIYNDCGVPMITPSATNPKLTQQGYQNVYRLLANDNALGAGLALHAANNLKLKKVAIIDDRSAYGQGVAEVFKKTAMARGMTVVDEQYTNDKATDFTAILTAIKAKQPDAVFYGCMDTQAGPVLRQMAQLGLFMPEKKSWESAWKAECQGQVDGCDGAIGIITKNTSRADGQLWELRCALDSQMKLLLVGDDEVCEMSAKKLPELIRDEDILPWDSSSISSFLNRLK